MFLNMSTHTESRRKRRFKDEVYDAVARVPAALANAHRLELLDLLSQRPRTVADVAVEAGLTVANASQHLGVLQRSGLVAVERRGTFAFYRIADPVVYRLLGELRSVVESVDSSITSAERAYFGSRDPGVQSYAEARKILQNRRTVLLDVRPREEFDTAHLPGAISIPVEDLRTASVPLSKARRYVVYCRGRFCVFADEAVGILHARGLDAIRLSLGPAEWLAAGGDVERVG
jgi:rhodanese-related sulfurtransferase/DNA-binding transcriptional ArsR family regulator